MRDDEGSSPPAPPHFLRLVALTATGYVGLGWLAQAYFTVGGLIGVFWPAAGWALGLALRHGRAAIWGGALGGLLLAAWDGHSLLACLTSAAAAGASAWLGHLWVTRGGDFDPQLPSVRAYVHLLVRGALANSLSSALIGISGLTLAGNLPMGSWITNVACGAVGNALGVIALAPALLLWRIRPIPSAAWKPLLEAGVCLVLIIFLGQIVYFDWYPNWVSSLPRHGFWVLGTLIWAAARLDRRYVTLLLVLATGQAMASLHQQIGLLSSSHDSSGEALLYGGLHQAVQCIAITWLTIYFDESKRLDAQLRIASIAFECQEGMIILDREARILRTNRSFTRITGYTAEEVKGQTTTFMRSDRHPASFYENAWRTAREQGQWADEVWHRRKSGEIFPQWLTATAVRDEQGKTTHFVVTHTDLTELKKKEAGELARQLAQRDALVREVHHRIKNSLQGITGILRQFARSYPQTEAVMSHSISLIKGIAALHGLQGSARKESSEAVYLHELLQSIAQDLRTVWKTPITVDQTLQTNFRIAASETVPIALILSELIVNAIKHGGQANGLVGVTLGPGVEPSAARIIVSNEGELPTESGSASLGGLMLIDSMMPRNGAHLSIRQLGPHVISELEINIPVISPASENHDA